MWTYRKHPQPRYYGTAKRTLAFGGSRLGVSGVQVVWGNLLLPLASQLKTIHLSKPSDRIPGKSSYHRVKATSMYIHCSRRMTKFRKHYLGQCEAGLWNGQSCSTVVSQVTAWTKELKHKTISKSLATITCNMVIRK